MKKILFLLTAILLIVTLTACAANTPTPASTEAEESEQTEENEPRPYISNCGDLETQLNGSGDDQTGEVEESEPSEETEAGETEPEEEVTETEKEQETVEEEEKEDEPTVEVHEETGSSGELFGDTLASKTTSLTDNDNRNNNVSLAAQAINGLVMEPGEVFSFNGTVGQRTAGKGYKEAAAYANGQTVYELGGGICQVSSTLYYCTLIADLATVDRDCHMFPVSYLPMGMDATVSWGGPDFKFRNSTDHPIKIIAYVDGLSLYVAIKGTKDNDHTFGLYNDIVSVKEYNTIEKESDEVTARREEVSGMNGYTVDLYRTEYDGNGNAIDTEYIDRSVYRSRDAVVLVPKAQTNEPDDEPEETESVEDGE